MVKYAVTLAGLHPHMLILMDVRTYVNGRDQWFQIQKESIKRFQNKREEERNTQRKTDI